MELNISTFITLIFLGFLVSLVNNSFGMGYGVIATPLLLFLGFTALVVVPALLVAQTVLGFVGTYFHSVYKNVDLTSRETKDTKITGIFTGFGLIGMTIAIFIAISVSELFIISYIGIMVSIVGLLLIKELTFKFSWGGIFIISIVAAFNQALIGGGYGPLATTGQLMSGRDHKEAASTSIFSQAFLSGYGFLLYFIFAGLANIELLVTLLIALIISGASATPLGALIAKSIPKEKGKKVIGYISLVLGVVTFARLVFYLIAGL
ncbi:MAG: sulfite exporter TauE/SafE family protein [Promethearchaeia archaeon]